MLRLGKIIWLKFRMELNFYFDYIIRAFTSKCTNFDVINQISEQVGYSLICSTSFDFGRHILHAIGERINVDREKIYFSRFLHLIYANLCSNESFTNDTKVPLF